MRRVFDFQLDTTVTRVKLRLKKLLEVYLTTSFITKRHADRPYGHYYVRPYPVHAPTERRRDEERRADAADLLGQEAAEQTNRVRVRFGHGGRCTRARSKSFE